MKRRIRIYAGQYFDQETGLHYNWHRYYDPALGRYLRADPFNIASIQNDEQILRIQSGFDINAFSIKHPVNGNKDKIFYELRILRQIIKEPEQQFSYAYASANPVNSIDPKGLSSFNTLFWFCKLLATNPCECDDDGCEKQVQRDEALCRKLKDPAARARCWQSANERYGACRAGRTLPPLVTW